MRVLLVSANRERKPSPVVPLGVLAVAGATRARHQVEVLDLCFEADPGASLAAAITRLAPDVVGLGLRNLASNAYDGTEGAIAGYRALGDVVRRATRAPLVLGGAAFSLQPERLLGEVGAAHGVVGEGEEAFPALLDQLERGERPPRLVRAPAWSRDLALESTATTAAATVTTTRLSCSLAGLPRPAHALADARYFAAGTGDRTANVQTKRGCAFSCTYCDYPDLEGRVIRMRDPREVADEAVECAAVPGTACLFLVDSVFNVPREHALAVCRALAGRGLDLPWVCYVSPASVDAALARTMASAGCVGVEIGSDAGTGEQLARLRKPFGREQIVAAHAHFAAAGIRDCHTFVLGAAGETPAQVRATLDFARELDPDVAVFVVFREDRATEGPHQAEHRAAILALLAREAPRHGAWIVPELGIRFGDGVPVGLSRRGIAGPTWLHWARLRRGVPRVVASAARAGR